MLACLHLSNFHLSFINYIKVFLSCVWVKNESAREYNAAALRVYFAPAFSAFKYESEFTTY